MAEPHFWEVQASEYHFGKQQRVLVDEIIEKAWYVVRFTDEDVRKLGYFALEGIVVIKSLAQIGDGLELISAAVDDDGKMYDSSIMLVSAESLLYEPKSPTDEGYFMNYSGYPGDALGVTAQEEIIYQKVY